MDYLQRLIRQAKIGLFIIFLLDNAVLIGAWWLANKILRLSAAEVGAVVLGVALIETTLIATSLGNFLMQPTRALWQAVLHLVPGNTGVAAPQPENLKFGGDLVSNLTAHIHELISVSDKVKTENKLKMSNLSFNFVASNLPLPLIVLDPSETIKFANQAAVDYIGIVADDLIGKNIYMVLDMSFPSESTFDKWLKKAKTTSATATATWERVKLNVRDNHPALLFDLAAYYNRDNPDHSETMMVLFDHTKQYSQDDQAISFVALSVHELRTPLTLLRGYIEVFEEELGDKVDAELHSFMEKMQSQAEQLMAFVNNILNVARVDDDQLELKLEAADWPATLKGAIEMLSLRAKVRGIALHCRLAKDLPQVAVDRLSIYEVINNLVDNAIKYSAKSQVINVSTYLTKDGLVETTVQDFGVGIPMSIMPNLFTKFYRDHRNRSQIGGTGLGLYLSRAIIQAHGGNLWVRSHEGQGSTFGFTLLPYSQLSAEAKKNGNQEITRGAHGWIKNHSLYRR